MSEVGCLSYSRYVAGLLPGNHQADKLSADLMRVDAQDILSTSLMQIVRTTLTKSANIKLDQVCCHILYATRCSQQA